MYEGLVLAIILLPLIGSIFTFVKRREIYALFVSSATFVLNLFLLPSALRGETFAFGWELVYGLSLSFIADPLSVFTALSISLIGALIVLYSGDYMRRYSHLFEYYFLILLFTGGMMGLVYSNNLLLMYVFWEITSICSWRLIGLEREDRDKVLMGDKAFLITFFGSAFLLLGLSMIYVEEGSLDLYMLKGTQIASLPLIFIFMGIIAKSAQVPLHSWLPDAGVAPTPAVALLHTAVLGGVYAFARIFPATIGIPEGWEVWVPIFAVSGSILCGFAALVGNDMGKILAYSTISQVAFIFLGFSVGTKLGFMGALLFILVHGLGKTGLFLSMGVVEHETGERDIRKISGLFGKMPRVGVFYLFCALSIMGIPPFGGFFSKLLIVMGVVDAGMIAVAVLSLFSAFLSMAYLMRLFYSVFLGEPEVRDFKERGPMLMSVGILAILSLITGILVFYPYRLLDITYRVISGVI